MDNIRRKKYIAISKTANNHVQVVISTPQCTSQITCMI